MRGHDPADGPPTVAGDSHAVDPRAPLGAAASSPIIDPEYTPAWSPDGSRITFTGYRSSDAVIWVVNADGPEPRQVTPVGPYGDYLPTWSPDGRSIAFPRVTFTTATTATTARVGIVAVAGGAPRFLDLPGNGYAPSWSPDGKSIALVSDAGGDLDIYVVSPDGEPQARIRRPGADRNPAWIQRTVGTG